MTKVRPEIHIRQMETEQDRVAFRTLNEEWITQHFTLEAKDRETLGDPDETIVAKGGRVFMVDVDGMAVGCVALIPMGGGVYEVSKMAVAPGLRGLGIGRKLLMYAIEQARAMGATSLFLGSSTKLPGAVHLYEALGFTHMPRERLPELAYARADVFMEMGL